jgi:hypothetical protein
MFNKIYTFLDKNAAGLTILITLIAGAYKFWEFVNIKKSDALQRDYENFHNLVEKLVVDRKEADGIPFIDVQIASVHELINYPRYYKVTLIILRRMRNRLKDKSLQVDLVTEIDKVSNYISKSWLHRKLTKI